MQAVGNRASCMVLVSWSCRVGRGYQPSAARQERIRTRPELFIRAIGKRESIRWAGLRCVLFSLDGLRQPTSLHDRPYLYLRVMAHTAGQMVLTTADSSTTTSRLTVSVALLAVEWWLLMIGSAECTARASTRMRRGANGQGSSLTMLVLD